MNDYKVPQDVEAEDKLIGPFNFRQFIYLIVVALCGMGAFGLFQLFPPLVIIPVPFILFFGALALPLRKDQPMEIYLAAVLSFYLKPRMRIWKQDGIEHLIQITAPNVVEINRTKGISTDEAVRRLSYLSDVVDTGGWAIKHAVSQDSSMHEDLYNEVKDTEDIFEDTRISNNIDGMIALNDKRRKQEIISHMNTARGLADFTNQDSNDIQKQAFAQAEYFAESSQPDFQSAENLSLTENPNREKTDIFGNIHVAYNPYPTSIRQSVIKPLSQQNEEVKQDELQQVEQTQIQQVPPQIPEIQIAPQPKPEIKKTVSTKPINDDIMKLVSEGKDLSVETIARQAKKIHEREILAEKEREGDLDEEVIISLR